MWRVGHYRETGSGPQMEHHLIPTLSELPVCLLKHLYQKIICTKEWYTLPWCSDKINSHHIVNF